MPHEVQGFLQFTLDDGRKLKITSKHFIYKTKCTSKNYSYIEIYIQGGPNEPDLPFLHIFTRRFLAKPPLGLRNDLGRANVSAG